ncbi:hypothetical protein IMCC3317_17030 [Kordia antarctica]|uniref:Uncharacterized protein n=1 Tax=Kordia antarctica TaxID=1218801 RepID=A0A7L4ZIL1_9FLAO|nr:hypothetical protein [Kordia antarctica]QHI36341.1 hypothetical protein IMCC3317_17030 [Kordia antarctica]
MSKKRQSPKLRTVNKSVAAYPLNQFSSEFPYTLGQEIVYLLASKGRADLEGSEWEQIFAICIGADWKPSNVGLDDVVMGNTAWGAKTVKSNVKDFKDLKKIRLISGRNSPVYSYGATIDTSANPNLIGEQVLEIWNERVSAIREKFKNLRTVVLVKSNDLSQVAVFEFDTIRYDSDFYDFIWNLRGNLEGFEKGTKTKRFTWQPHGSQFTIHEGVPEQTLILNIKQPEKLNKEKILETIGFDKSWVTIKRK